MIEEKEYIMFDGLNNDEIIHLFTKKPMDFNRSKLSITQIEKNYNILNNLTNNCIETIISANQMHTSNVRVVNDSNYLDEFKNTDGLITNLKGIALATYVADCQSILLYDPVKKVIGNIHSGWRGTLNKIIKNAINIMINEYDCNPKNIRAYICPSICSKCFEVQSDVKDQFVDSFKEIDINKYIYKDNSYHIDTIGINTDIMINLGLDKENIISSNICTMCNSDKYHSYRKEKEESGRNIAIIALKK